MNIVDFFIPKAMAADAAEAASGQSSSSLLFVMVIVVAMMYFMVWRPQNKRAKEQRNLVNALAEGDEVLTSSGIVGKIKKIDDQFMMLTVAEGVTVRIQKAAVVSALPKGTLT